MELTGKAKEAFLKHSIGKEIALFEAMLPIYQHALIIEWLDSVGIYVYVEPSIPIGWENPDCFIFKVGTDTNRLKFHNRQQATEKAIEMAIEIYNNNFL